MNKSERTSNNRNFDPTESFFVIDSEHLDHVKTKLYGYCIQHSAIIESETDLDGEAVTGEGAYIYVKREENRIIIQQDFIGCWGLYLFRDGDYFALSNSFIMLVDHVKASHRITLNQNYANYFVVVGLCSVAYSETMVNEISLLDRSTVIEIDIPGKNIDASYIDYGENTVDIRSEEGIRILDRWHGKWTKLIRNLSYSDCDLQAALSGGFDTRMVFTLLLTAGIDLSRLYVRSLTDGLHTHTEDYEIASQIAERYRFELNDESCISGMCDNYSIEDILNISFYTKLCFHKQMYFKHSRLKKRRVIFAGNGGECVRDYWNLSKEEYIRNALGLCKKYRRSIAAPMEKSINAVLESSFEGISRKYKSIGRPVNPTDLSFNLYRETRCRNHFGKSLIESYFANQITLCPLLDPDLHKLKLANGECSDRNLLMAVIFDRYCKGLLEFNIEGNRKIENSTIQYAAKINEEFPYQIKYNNDYAEEYVFNSNSTRPVQMYKLAKVLKDEPDMLLRNAFRSDSMKGIFSILFDQEIYDQMLEETETRKYFPLQDVYAAIGVCKILQDELTYNTLICSSVSDYVKSQMSLERQYKPKLKILKSLANHPYLENYITGRIDVRFFGGGSGSGSIEIISVSDPDAEITSPPWINKEGCGYVLSSKTGEIQVTFRCLHAGNLTVKLRGKDVRNKQGKRIPFWVDYTVFQVNDEKVFDQIHPVCHDLSWQYTKKVGPEETVTLLIEWQPHDETVGDTAEQNEKLIKKKVLRSLWHKLGQRIRIK